MIKKLEEYEERGLLTKQKHPTKDLFIWNYTPEVQYGQIWDEVTLQCRGLITDSSGNVIVRPFTKFFNYEELLDSEVIPKKGDYVYVQEKVDGSLGILFHYDDEWMMATRGSFTSDQAIKGLEILKSKYVVFDQVWLKEYAYLVEIIYPENRIVVDYGEEKIVFLSAVLNQNWRWEPTEDTELHWTTACCIFAANGIKGEDIVKTEQYFNFSDELYKSLKEKNENNKEGFVLRYQPGNFRMKIKFEEYVRLHKIMTNLSTTAVWEVLASGKNMNDILKDVPDEFFSKIKEYEKSLIDEYCRIELMCIEFLTKYRHLERKEYALEVEWHKYSSVLFALYGGKPHSQIIWKKIKPKFRKL